MFGLLGGHPSPPTTHPPPLPGAMSLADQCGILPLCPANSDRFNIAIPPLCVSRRADTGDQTYAIRELRHRSFGALYLRRQGGSSHVYEFSPFTGTPKSPRLHHPPAPPPEPPPLDIFSDGSERAPWWLVSCSLRVQPSRLFHDSHCSGPTAFPHREQISIGPIDLPATGMRAVSESERQRLFLVSSSSALYGWIHVCGCVYVCVALLTSIVWDIRLFHHKASSPCASPSTRSHPSLSKPRG